MTTETGALSLSDRLREMAVTTGYRRSQDDIDALLELAASELDLQAAIIANLRTRPSVDPGVVERVRDKAAELAEFAALRDSSCTERAFHERANAGMFAADLRALLSALEGEGK